MFWKNEGAPGKVPTTFASCMYRELNSAYTIWKTQSTQGAIIHKITMLFATMCFNSKISPNFPPQNMKTEHWILIIPVSTLCLEPHCMDLCQIMSLVCTCGNIPITKNLTLFYSPPPSIWAIFSVLWSLLCFY